ncbi:MAG: hypothetical protein HQL64_14940, partial [Magnetococcales bacterium]|nr:hypothetical protein [Magnetococcales bacterium]
VVLTVCLVLVFPISIFGEEGLKHKEVNIDLSDLTAKSQDRRSIKQALKLLPEHLTSAEEWKEQMLNSLQEHLDLNKSMELMKEKEKSKLDMVITGMLKQFASNQTGLNPDTWPKEMLDKNQNTINEIIKKSLDGGFLTNYTEGRNMAAKQQRDGLEKRCFVKPEEVESLVDLISREIPNQKAASLVERLHQKVLTEKHLFRMEGDPLKDNIRTQIDKELDHIRWQENFIKGFKPIFGKFSEEIYSNMEQELIDKAKQLEKGSPQCRGQSGFSPYSGLKKLIGEQAQSLEWKAFRTHILDELDLEKQCPGLPRSEIISALDKSSDWPMTLSAHLEELNNSFSEKVRQSLVNNFLTEENTYRQARSNRLTERIIQRSNLEHEAFTNNLQRCLQNIVETKRKERAENNLKRRFPDIVTGIYEIKDDKKVDNLVEKFQKKIGTYENLEDNQLETLVGEFPSDLQQVKITFHLNEERESFSQHANKLVREALNTFGKQKSLVETTIHDAPNGNVCYEPKGGDNVVLSLKERISKCTDTLTRQWNSNHTRNKYAYLFPSNRKLIEKLLATKSEAPSEVIPKTQEVNQVNSKISGPDPSGGGKGGKGHGGGKGDGEGDGEDGGGSGGKCPLNCIDFLNEVIDKKKVPNQCKKGLTKECVKALSTIK